MYKKINIDYEALPVGTKIMVQSLYAQGNDLYYVLEDNTFTNGGYWFTKVDHRYPHFLGSKEFLTIGYLKRSRVLFELPEEE